MNEAQADKPDEWRNAPNRLLAVRNPLGMHTTPIAKFCGLAQAFVSDIRVVSTFGTADAKSILELLAVPLAYGAEFIVQAKGVDAEQAIKALATLVESGFHLDEELDD